MSKITLYQYTPAWGLPNPSPFCTKVETYLRMAEIPFESVSLKDPRKAPKGKLPYIEDGGTTLADSALILEHLKRTRGDALDAWLTPEQRAVGHAVAVMLEERTYWVEVKLRWADDATFHIVEQEFLSHVPKFVRALFLNSQIKKTVRRNLWGHGLGRHSQDEIDRLAAQDIDAVSGVLGDKPFLLGDKPSSYDATVFAFMLNYLGSVTVFPSKMKDYLKTKANVVAYVDRVRSTYFPPV